MKTLSRVFPLLVLLLSACQPESNDLTDPLPGKSIRFDFSQDAQGWQHGFADLPTDGPLTPIANFDLVFEHTDAPIGTEKALRMAGSNLSDDLFMFIYKKIEELEPNETYTLEMIVDLLSPAAAGLAGIGGAPGESVYVKAGAINFMPEVLENKDFLEVNFDKGNQSQSGADMLVIGDIAHPGEPFTYESIRRSTQDVFTVQTNDQGEIWLLLGTDSGFEGRTDLYYQVIEVDIQLVE